ncbi:PRTRC system ParB family protein [Novosphingobium resinovorum]|uniref:Chromosome partitioning protein ParB n=1 Tax=Novosphingobium resinovorum TaxID=158500 RepID=A0A1D8A2E2_9SPHN|nr:PRTRC system ParB family protein [Novosphingobium resinovorum]AOR76303.1 chromosome partitioning protein ParB [Novosphingobium resinovorum]
MTLDTKGQQRAVVLPLSSITPGYNPRRYFDSKAHEELVASLQLRGMLQPMLVRPAPDGGEGYLLVAGGRRYRAALEAFGRDGNAPVLIRDMTDDEAVEAAIDENDVRDDASETEQADAAVRVLAASQNDRAEAARRLGWSPAKLDRRLALANLSEPVKLALDERRIKVGHAELLAAVPGDKQEKALDTILTAGLDVNKTRELLMRVTQSLAAARFDKAECTACPFNSAAQRALFATHVEDGHCTNPGCFQLKTESAEPVADEKNAVPAPDAAPAEPDVSSSAPRSAIVPKKASPTEAPKQTVNAAMIASRAADVRESAWRAALIQAGEGDPEILRAFESILRDTWKVDAVFLGRFGKDELKFIAKECGLIDHMGTKAFAKLMQAKTDAIVAGMLNATGFDWSGRLPGALTLDGKYSPPAVDASVNAPSTTEKDSLPC